MKAQGNMAEWDIDVMVRVTLSCRVRMGRTERKDRGVPGGGRGMSSGLGGQVSGKRQQG